MASKPKKPAAPEAEKFPRKAIPCQSGPSDDEKGRAYANLINSPELAAHRIVSMMQPKNLADEIDVPGMLETLRDQAAAVQRGDLAHAEAMLINQASALQSLFVRLTERAMEQGHMPNLEGFMRMALGAPAFISRSKDELQRWYSFDKFKIIALFQKGEMSAIGIYDPLTGPIRFNDEAP